MVISIIHRMLWGRCWNWFLSSLEYRFTQPINNCCVTSIHVTHNKPQCDSLSPALLTHNKIASVINTSKAETIRNIITNAARSIADSQKLTVIIWCFSMLSGSLVVSWTFSNPCKDSVHRLQIIIQHIYPTITDRQPEPFGFKHLPLQTGFIKIFSLRSATPPPASPHSPQSCILSLLLFTLLTHDCFIKFINDISFVLHQQQWVSVQRGSDRMVYRQSSNVDKKKEIIDDFSRHLALNEDRFVDEKHVNHVRDLTIIDKDVK